MRIQSLIYFVYITSRRLIRAMGLIRPIRRLFGPLLGRYIYRITHGRIEPLLINGHQMVLATGTSYPPIDMLRDTFERETTKLFNEIIEPGSTVIDVGAHVGYYTLLAARLTGSSGVVFAFEPEPQNYALLVRNIDLNGYTNVTPLKRVISSSSGTSTLFLTPLDSGRHSTYQLDVRDTECICVQSTTIDQFIESIDSPHIDLIKIDVEGAESDVFTGMPKLLNQPKPLEIIMEFNPTLLRIAGVDPLAFVTMPLDWGFEIFTVDEVTGMQPLPDTGLERMVDRMIKIESSLNLYCRRI